MDARTFIVNVPQATLDDLQDRLMRTRWPDEIQGMNWGYGVPLAYMKEITEYWRNGFEWRVQEQRINAFANYKATVDDVDIHFIHERGHGPQPLPLMLVHGWPSSFVEMLDLIPCLTDPVSYGGDPTDAFDVVVPSIPGHGFSDRPRHRGFEDRHVGGLFVKLMHGLGYNRFATHAYDIGASVTGLLCLDYPENVIGYHTTSPSIYLKPDISTLTEVERAYVEYLKRWSWEEGGYAHVQATRPQTLAYGLNDSPVGLAAWILDKWYTWTTPPSGNLEQHFTKDQLLTNVMIYWVTETMNSANRYYAEAVRMPRPEDRVHVPLGITLTATQPFERPPREYVERFYVNIQRWEEFGCGGHFIAGEEPERVAAAIQSFFRKFR